jgi:hypothetical protein
VYGLPTCQTIKLGGQSYITTCIYAPEADVSLNGGGSAYYHFVGYLMAHSITLAGNMGFHYDEGVASPKVVAPPIITDQTTNQTVILGTNVTLIVRAIGPGPLWYQWFFNQTNLLASGTNYSSLTLTNVQLSATGIYSVLVSYAFTSTTSSNVTLTVLAPPVITMQPTNQIVLAGSTATFLVQTFGSEALNFQWQKNGTNLVDGGNISGVSSNMLTIADISEADAASYRAIVSDDSTSVTSSNAVLTVYATAATLTGYGFSAGNGFQFQVTGVPDLNYAVQSSTNLVDWISLTTNTSPFTFTETNPGDWPQHFFRAVYFP